MLDNPFSLNSGAEFTYAVHPIGEAGDPIQALESRMIAMASPLAQESIRQTPGLGSDRRVQGKDPTLAWR